MTAHEKSAFQGAAPDIYATLEALQAQLAAPPSPRTAKLLRASTAKKARKLVEEATEVALDAVAGSRSGLVAESVDLLYHLAVLWHDRGIDPAEVRAEMARRAAVLGIVEKRPKKGPAKRALKSLERAAGRPFAEAPVAEARVAETSGAEGARPCAIYREGDSIGPVRVSEMQRP